MERAGKCLVLSNGRVLTMEKDSPLAEALVTRGDKIVYVGALEGIGEELVSGKEVIDLGGRTVVPGFIDSHLHLVEMAKTYLGLDLGGYTSLREVLRILEEEVKRRPRGSWVVGYNWDESLWEEGRLITLDELDRVSPRHPVILKRVCLHLVLANSLALEMARVKKDTPGLHLDTTGRPNGRVEREARRLVEACLKFHPQEMETAMEVVQKKMLSLGITSFHHMGSNFPLIERVSQEGKLILRTYLCISEDEILALGTEPQGYSPGALPPGLKGLSPGQGNDKLKVGAIKFFVDGSLGAHSAALLEPYEDEPENYGRLRWNQAQLRDKVVEFHKEGWQLALHAIGDRAILAALEVLEEAQERFPRENHRHRLEHCELLPEGAMERIKGLDLIVSAQPNFVAQWGFPGGLYQKKLGRRRWGKMNPLREFYNMSIPLAFGSDGMPLDPLYGIWSAANHPVEESRLSPLEALYCYSRGSAFASFEEDLKGTIQPGKLADLAVLSQDPTTVPIEEIKDIRVEITILGGEVLYNILPRQTFSTGRAL
jgi:predicted amidohydrolase YtcJ